MKRHKIYMEDPDPGSEGKLLLVGSVSIDENDDAWVKIDKDIIAWKLSVEDIDGMALLDNNSFLASLED